MKRTLFCITAMLTITAMLHAAPQKQPDAKRVLEIRAALITHGYEPGKSWTEVQELLRGIAREHGWQTHHAPDARVLILLGLGNEHSDPYVATHGTNHLDYKKTQDPEDGDGPTTD
jgi:hypothetical protein